MVETTFFMVNSLVINFSEERVHRQKTYGKIFYDKISIILCKFIISNKFLIVDKKSVIDLVFVIGYLSIFENLGYVFFFKFHIFVTTSLV